MEAGGQARREGVGLAALFSIFLAIGAFTIGGGYAMLPLVERELVGRRWLSHAEFGDLLAVAQATPGVLAVNVALGAGYRLRGLAGALTATMGAALPSFVTILVLAFFLGQVGGHPQVEAFLRGARPAVVALLVYAAGSMLQRLRRSPAGLFLVAGSAAAILFLRVHPALVLLAAAVTGGALLGPRFRPGGDAKC